eukprot:6200560-Pleurochrysis_carterae.AAC.2
MAFPSARLILLDPRQAQCNPPASHSQFAFRCGMDSGLRQIASGLRQIASGLRQIAWSLWHAVTGTFVHF